MTTHHSSVDWKHELTFDAHQNKQTFTLVSSTSNTTEPGISPKNMLLTALAGCTAMDVASLLPKMRVPFTTLRVRVDGELTDEHPRVYKNINMIYEVGTSEEFRPQVERAIAKSTETYCGVHAMLSKGSMITHDLIFVA
jgi:putative redox protein